MASLDSQLAYKLHPAAADGNAVDINTITNDPWGLMFGNPRAGSPTSPYDSRDQETWVMPDGLTGRPLKMPASTIEYMAFVEGSWYTSVVCPIVRMENQSTITWSKFVFGEELPGHLPYLGAPRVLSAKQITNTASFERRGLAIFMEYGFMNTERGRKIYMGFQRQIARMVEECAKFDVIAQLLDSQKMNLQNERKYGVYTDGYVPEVHQRMLSSWACVQRFERALELLDADISETMARMNPPGRADTYIMSKRVAVYAQLIPQ